MKRFFYDNGVPRGPFPTGDMVPHGTVTGRYDVHDVGDALADVSSTGANAGGQQSQYVGLSVSRATLRAAFIVIGVGLAVVCARAAQIQVVKGGYYAGLAENNRSRTEWTPAERGIIYDRHGTPLVSNEPIFSAAVTPADLPKDPAGRRTVLAALADIAGTDPASIEKTLSDYGANAGFAIPVARGLTHDQAVRLQVLAADMHGISLVVGTKRDYLKSAQIQSLSHILGYTGLVDKAHLDADKGYLPTDQVGKAGLERSYESELRGTYGKKEVEVDAFGNVKTVISQDPPVPGKNLVLSIDLDLQAEAEKALRASLTQFGLKSGSVVIMNPKTGEVLALVSWPSYDDNLFSGGISTADYDKLMSDPNHPLFQRSIAASLPAGSTFKLVVASAALQEHIVTPQTTFLSTGGIRVNQWFFPDWQVGGHGITNIYKAIADSVNTYFYIVGGGYKGREGLGVERITKYAGYFGLGSPLGIDLPGENSGFLPSKAWKEKVKGQPWFVGDTYHLAIGQGDLLVTPLQIASITATVANGGDVVRPHVVDAITTDSGERDVIPTTVISHVPVDAKNLQVVRAGMRQSVTAGSSHMLQDLPVKAAGKTGTAQWSPTAPPHAWFTSFAPYDDPQLVVTVNIEDGIEGWRTAEPVANDIYKWYYAHHVQDTSQ